MKMAVLADAGKWMEPCNRYFPSPPRFLTDYEQLQAAEADVYIVHSDSIEFERFCDWAESRLKESKLFAVVTGDLQSVRQWKRFCLSRSIVVWEENDRYPADDIAAEISRLLPDRAESASADGNRTVLFTGTTPNIGTTVAAFGTALGVARSTDSQVAYLCLNLKSSKAHHYLGVDQPGTTLDGMRTDLKTGSLTPQRFRQYCHRMGKTPNLHVLFGNLYREQAEFYTPEDIRHLLDTASKTFDCCIVDVNAYWDNAATVCAALHADLKIAVTSNRLSCFQEDFNRNLKLCCELVDLSHRDFDLLVVDDPFGGLYRARDIRKETGLNIIAHMRAYPELTRYLDLGKLEDFYREDERALKDLLPLVRTIRSLFLLADKARVDVKKMKLSPLRFFHG